MKLANQISCGSLVRTGESIDIAGVARKAMSSACFSDPPGRRERRDGTMNNHHHQNPNTLIGISLSSVF